MCSMQSVDVCSDACKDDRLCSCHLVRWAAKSNSGRKPQHSSMHGQNHIPLVRRLVLQARGQCLQGMWDVQAAEHRRVQRPHAVADHGAHGVAPHHPPRQQARPSGRTLQHPPPRQVSLSRFHPGHVASDSFRHHSPPPRCLAWLQFVWCSSGLHATLHGTRFSQEQACPSGRPLQHPPPRQVGLGEPGFVLEPSDWAQQHGCACSWLLGVALGGWLAGRV